MTIVTTRPRKRPAKAAQAAETKVPRIVQHTPRGRCVEATAARSGGRGADRRALRADGHQAAGRGLSTVSLRSAFSLPSVPSRSKHTGGRALTADGNGTHGEDLEDLLTQAARARRLARAIPNDPMGLRLAQVADELDAEIARHARIIGRDGIRRS
jgi:hypothetical protein